MRKNEKVSFVVIVIGLVLVAFALNCFGSKPDPFTKTCFGSIKTTIGNDVFFFLGVILIILGLAFLVKLGKKRRKP